MASDVCTPLFSSEWEQAVIGSKVLAQLWDQEGLGFAVYKANMTHVDAVPLHHRHPPPSLSNHTQLDDNDRDIWDRAYANEYLDLVEDTVPWVYITGEEY